MECSTRPFMLEIFTHFYPHASLPWQFPQMDSTPILLLNSSKSLKNGKYKRNLRHDTYGLATSVRSVLCPFCPQSFLLWNPHEALPKIQYSGISYTNPRIKGLACVRHKKSLSFHVICFYSFTGQEIKPTKTKHKHHHRTKTKGRHHHKTKHMKHSPTKKHHGHKTMVTTIHYTSLHSNSRSTITSFWHDVGRRKQSIFGHSQVLWQGVLCACVVVFFWWNKPS